MFDTTNGIQISLAEKTSEVNQKIEEIIGLGANEFTKCIILPQGEFSTFVKSTKTERVKIVEKLFDLDDRTVEDAKLVQQKLKLYTDIPLRKGDILRKKI